MLVKLSCETYILRLRESRLRMNCDVMIGVVPRFAKKFCYGVSKLYFILFNLVVLASHVATESGTSSACTSNFERSLQRAFATKTLPEF